MKTQNTFLLTIIFLTSFFILALNSCSDHDDEVLPDDDTPGKVFDIDGNEYKTVKIGDQLWTAENLHVTRYNNGDAIPTGLSNSEWENTTNGAYATSIPVYGNVYNWFTVNDPRGLCPEGWSVPTDDEWTQLVNYVISHGYPNDYNDAGGAGYALRSCRQVESPLGGECDTHEHPRWAYDFKGYGFDTFNFSALPNASRGVQGNLSTSVGGGAGWWSSTESSSSTAYLRGIDGSYGWIFRINGFDKRHGESVRCVRDID